jgi:hypothetical protein
MNRWTGFDEVLAIGSEGGRINLPRIFLEEATK